MISLASLITCHYLVGCLCTCHQWHDQAFKHNFKRVVKQLFFPPPTCVPLVLQCTISVISLSPNITSLISSLFITLSFNPTHGPLFNLPIMDPWSKTTWLLNWLKHSSLKQLHHFYLLLFFCLLAWDVVQLLECLL